MNKTKSNNEGNAKDMSDIPNSINPHRKRGFYEKYIKRLTDIVCALLAITVFSPIYILVAVLVRVKLGSPIIFKQARPGLNEKIFTLYKFRTMTDKKDENGNLLPDDVRLTKFGRLLRKTSLDELPEAFNILKGDMSIVGPRPQLVVDMLFMTDRQRLRHTVRPGLSGLAQVNGRNAISWEDKLNYDLEYIENKITFWNDLKIVILTVFTAFVKKEGISQDGFDTSEDLGDYLLRTNKIDNDFYTEKVKQSRELMGV